MKCWTICLILSTVLLASCSKEEKELLVFAGAGLKDPLQEIACAFEKDIGISVKYNFAGCGQHLSQMEMSSEGDVFIAGSNYHAELALDKGLIEQVRPIAYHIPIIAISNTCQKELDSLDDLQKEGIVIGFGDPEATAIGKLTWKILKSAGISEVVKNNDIVYTSTVNELMTHLEMGTIEATITWEDLIYNKDDIKVVNIPKEYNQIKTIPGSIVKKTENHKEGLMFLEYLRSENGESIFEKHGFKVVDNE